MGKLTLVGIIIALAALWPAIRSSTAGLTAARDQQIAETKQKIEDYKKVSDELGLASPFPPKEILAKKDAEARKLKAEAGGSSVFDGAVSAMGPTFMQVEMTYRGIPRCQAAVKSFAASDKEVRIEVNGKTVHRLEAWKLCAGGVNQIVVTRG